MPLKAPALEASRARPRALVHQLPQVQAPGATLLPARVSGHADSYITSPRCKHQGLRYLGASRARPACHTYQQGCWRSQMAPDPVGPLVKTRLPNPLLFDELCMRFISCTLTELSFNPFFGTGYSPEAAGLQWQQRAWLPARVPPLCAVWHPHPGGSAPGGSAPGGLALMAEEQEYGWITLPQS
jgi:hypothetical protein